MDHSLAVAAWAALAACTFPVLFFVSAPYGKLVRDGWGPRVDGRLGWFAQEIVSPVVLTLAFLRGGDAFTFSHPGTSPPGAFARACVAVWWAHYLHRAVYYPLVRRMSDTTLPVVAMAVCFNVVNGTLMGVELARGGAYLAHPDPRTLAVGFAVFVTGAAINVSSDAALLRLRKRPGDRKHYVPRGGLFELVAAPHYFGECVEWVGFAAATRTSAGWAFAFWTFANLYPRAVAYRRWYVEKFGAKFPRERRAMIPFAL